MNKVEAMGLIEDVIDPGDWASVSAILTDDGEAFAVFTDTEGMEILRKVQEQLLDLSNEAEERARSVTELLTIAECTDLRARARTIHGDNEVVVAEDAIVDTSPEDGCWVEAKLWVPKEENQ